MRKPCLEPDSKRPGTRHCSYFHMATALHDWKPACSCAVEIYAHEPHRTPAASDKLLQLRENASMTVLSSDAPKGEVAGDNLGTEPEDRFISQIHSQSKKPNESLSSIEEEQSQMTPSHAYCGILDVLANKIAPQTPIWLMRQAGRYLPEYREIRARAGSFLDLCFTPELAAEVTLQPIRRFGFDAAIIFSDILVIPYALGREVRFEVGEGPRLDPLDTPEKIAGLATHADFRKLGPVYEALRRVRSELADNIALI